MRSLSLPAFGLLAASAVLTAGANLLIRHGLLRAAGFSLAPRNIAGEMLKLLGYPSFSVGVALYALSALVWFRVLSLVEVSTGYPILVGLTFVLVSVGAVVAFHESMSLFKLAGVLVILLGIILVARA
jgi:multidrug transporter EmrE-like cation transporter